MYQPKNSSLLKDLNVYRKRILIAPSGFKGTLLPHQVAHSIEVGLLRKYQNDVLCIKRPVADGGAGSTDIFFGNGANVCESKTVDLLGNIITAKWAFNNLPEFAFIEVASVVGFQYRTDNTADQLLRANSFGLGQLIREAMKRSNNIIVGLGDTASIDAGIGLAMSLGFKFRDSNGDEISWVDVVSTLNAVKQIIPPPNLKSINIIAAVDTFNPLCGRNGQAMLYGEQKGLGTSQFHLVDEALNRYATAIKGFSNVDTAGLPGTSAGGGIAATLIGLLGAKLQSGFDVIAKTLELEKEIEASDIVITGEGRFDKQTLQGKAPYGVAKLCNSLNKPVIALVGSVDSEIDQGLFSKMYVIDEIIGYTEGLSPAEKLELAVSNILI